MGYRIFVANALVLSGITWILASGAETHATELLPRKDASTDNRVAALETRASLSPSAPAVVDLATAYLERDQSGLAAAVIEHAPREIQKRADVAQVYARVLYHRGKAREALAVAREARETCEDGWSHCPAWLDAKTTRQVAFLEEVVAAGIDDPLANPAATRAAYERSTREVQMVAMR